MTTPHRRRCQGTSKPLAPSHKKHKGYSHAISPQPDEDTPLSEGQCVAVYFEDKDDWFEGVIAEGGATGGLVRVHFNDGDWPQPLSAHSYGRFNLWVLPDLSRRREKWSANGHQLLGEQLVHEGADGVLRMWCAARRLFAMSVNDGVGMETEVLVAEAEAVRSVTEQRGWQQQRAEAAGESIAGAQTAQEAEPILASASLPIGSQVAVEKPGPWTHQLGVVQAKHNGYIKVHTIAINPRACPQ